MEQKQNQQFNIHQAISDDNLDIKRYLSLYLSNWYWFTFALFVSLCLAYGINRYSESMYTVSSTLLIKDDQVGGGNTGKEAFLPGVDMFRSQQNLKNEMGILRSFSLNLRVVDSLQEFDVVYVGLGRRNIVEKKLYKECPFKVISEIGIKQPEAIHLFVRISSDTTYSIQLDGDKMSHDNYPFGKRFNYKGFDFTIELRDRPNFRFNKDISYKYLFYFTNSQGLANQYRSSLSISPIEKDASIVSLSLSGPSASEEADYLNKLMELYIKQGIEFKNRTADSTIKFIENQLKLISNTLKIAEGDLQEFRKSNKIVNISTEGNLMQSKLEQFETEKINLQLKQKYYNYLSNYLASKNESGDIISPSLMGIENQLLSELVQQFAIAQQQKIQLIMNLDQNLPPVSLLMDKIANLKERLVENVKNSQETIKLSISEVDRSISLVNEELMKLPDTERQMINFQRKFDLNNTVYTYLLEKKSEAGIAKASNVSDNRIIDYAQVFNSVQIRPQTRKNYVTAWGLGFLIPAILIFLIDFLNNKIIDKKDVEKGTSAPLIGYIGHSDVKSEIPVVDKPASILAESFRSIRTSMKYFVEEHSHPVILITSTISAEGKTFISVNLAAITAMLGKKVLLVGLDLRKPRIHKVFDISNETGISLYLANGCTYKDVIQKTHIENLSYAASGPIPPNPAELIESARMKEFIMEAKKEFDIIIIDTPPIALVTDTLLLSKLVDMNIFVVRQRYSSKNTLGLIQELYQSGKMNNMGIVINDISLSGYYGYGLSYGYAMGYGYSYGNNFYGRYYYGKDTYSQKARGYYSNND
jgi:tyrosine-protein kinase Etk/Wzc